MEIFTFIIFLFFTQAQALIGYDCGSRHLNITTISLLEVGECDIPKTPINVARTYIQLLQINQYSAINVIQCKVEIHRIVYHCGMFSHNSIVRRGEAEFIHEVSAKACQQMHLTGVFKYNDKSIITEIKVNSTTVHPMTFSGFVSDDRRCNGASYADPYGEWQSVVVQGTIKITLRQQSASIVLEQNKIHLKSGVICKLSDTSCIDYENGYTFWNTIPFDRCNTNRYGILYEGMANKISEIENSNSNVMYTLSSNDVTFALSTRGQENICGFTIIKTEHPKLLIFETSKGLSFVNKNKISVENLDIFAYVNSKFIYVEKHIKSQVKNLYYDALTQRCKLEQQALKNSLAIAVQTPDMFAYNLMQGPGYMAVVAGEVVHIIKCIPVDVKLQHGEECYTELQVTRQNITYYLTPITHMLKSAGTKVSCNAILPAHYRIHEEWIKIMPRPIESKPPIVIKPMSAVSWKYINPGSLATSGIYTEKDLEELRDRIMFPVEMPSLLNDLAREMRSNSITDNEGTIERLLNENTMDKLLENTWNRMWKRFISFGTASAGVIAILMIVQGLKIIVGAMVNGFLLHRMYGCSLHILGAFWSSIAQLLIHLGGRVPPPNNEEENQTQQQETRQPDVEMGLLTPTNRPSAPHYSQTATINPTINTATTVQPYSKGFFNLH